MAEYINRNELVENLDRFAPEHLTPLIRTLIEKQPTADVVKVVRCKDCIHWGGLTYGFVCRKFSGIDTKICMGADHFCSYGTPKERGGEK